MSEQAAASGLKEKILAKKWIIIGIVIIVLLGGVLWRYFTGDSQSTIITETPEKIYKIKVLLFYKFNEITDPEYFVRKHKQKCKELGVLGKVLVAKEGINGSV